MTRHVVVRDATGEHLVPIGIARHQIQVGAAVLVTEAPSEPAITVETQMPTRGRRKDTKDSSDAPDADPAGA